MRVYSHERREKEKVEGEKVKEKERHGGKKTETERKRDTGRRMELNLREGSFLNDVKTKGLIRGKVTCVN